MWARSEPLASALSSLRAILRVLPSVEWGRRRSGPPPLLAPLRARGASGVGRSGCRPAAPAAADPSRRSPVPGRRQLLPAGAAGDRARSGGGVGAASPGAARARRCRQRARLARRPSRIRTRRLRRRLRRVGARGRRQAIEPVRHRHLPERDPRGDRVRFAHVATPAVRRRRDPRKLFSSSASAPSIAVSGRCRSVVARAVARCRRTRSRRAGGSGPAATTSRARRNRAPRRAAGQRLGRRGGPVVRALLAVDDDGRRRRPAARTTQVLGDQPRARALERACRGRLAGPAPPANAVSPSGSTHADACRTVTPRRCSSLGVIART